MQVVELVDTFEPAETLEIRRLDTLKVMADSLRMQIVDLLRRRPATVKEIAAELDLPPKSLYYHVNLLERHALIRIVDTRLVSGILEKRYRATAYLFNFAELATGSDKSPGQQRIEALSSIFAITRDEIRIGLESGLIATDEEAPAATCLDFEWNLLALSPAEVHELETRVHALLKEYHSDDPISTEGQPYRLLFTLFPTYRRGERPGPTPFSVTGGETQ